MKITSLILSSLLLGSAAFAEDCADGECCPSKGASRAAAMTEVKGTAATFVMNDMTCGGCATKVTAAIEKVEGKHSFKVDAESRTATIDFDAAKVTKEKLVEAINASGFKVNAEIVSMNVSGMTCGSCEEKVKVSLAEVKGIQKVETVDSKAGLVKVQIDPTADTKAISAAIEAAGFKVS